MRYSNLLKIKALDMELLQSKYRGDSLYYICNEYIEHSGPVLKMRQIFSTIKRWKPLDETSWCTCHWIKEKDNLTLLYYYSQYPYVAMFVDKHRSYSAYPNENYIQFLNYLIHHTVQMNKFLKLVKLWQLKWKAENG